jgi:copper chaperone NosL
MKRQFMVFLATVFFLALATPALAEDDIEGHKACAVCSMDREKLSYSRIYLVFEDGTRVGTCSIHCATVFMSNNSDRVPKTIWVADYNTRKLIDAEKAGWVIGGRKAGVMTRQAKWAFGDNNAAKAFIKENGGTIVTFDQVRKASYSDSRYTPRTVCAPGPRPVRGRPPLLNAIQAHGKVAPPYKAHRTRLNLALESGAAMEYIIRLSPDI